MLSYPSCVSTREMTWDITHDMQGPVVQRVDNAIQRINHYLVDKGWQNKVRYPLDNVIHSLNNWGQVSMREVTSTATMSLLNVMHLPTKHERALTNSL